MKKNRIMLASGLGSLFLSIAFLASCTENAQEGAAIAAGTGIAGIWICFIVIVSLVSLGLFVFWIIMLIDCIKRKPEDYPSGGENEKTTWMVIMIVSFFVMSLNGIAAIIYYFMVRKKKPINY